jgi:hypothetical protein
MGGTDNRAAAPASREHRIGFKLYRYGTTDDVGTRETLQGDHPETIEGPLYDLIRSAVDRTVSMVESVKKLGPKGP